MMSMGLEDPNKTYANLAEANRTSWGAIVALQELVAEGLRWQLLPEFGVDPHGFVWEYDYTHVQELQEVARRRSRSNEGGLEGRADHLERSSRAARL